MSKIIPDIFTYQHNELKNLKNFIELQKEIADLELQDFKAVSVCFLVDATGSMQPYVTQVKNQIKSIIDKIKGNHQQSIEIFLSMVAYRDRNDFQSFETLKFTKSVDEFQQFVEQLNFYGGDDQCEDVKIGLQQVIKLEWKQDNLNLLLWMADSPCHGKEFHLTNANDNYTEDSVEDIKQLLQEISEQQIDLYFYRINETTDQMISQFSKYIFVYDRLLRQQNFKEKSFSINVSQNVQNSSYNQAFSQFMKFTNSLKKTKQVEKALELKNKIKNYQKIIIEHENLNKQINQLEADFDQKNIQEGDIKNFGDLQKVSKQFKQYKFNLNQDSNKIDCVKEKYINLELTIEVVGQGAFKDVYLAKNDDSGALYALKKLKNSNQLDFDNLITEYYIYLLSKEIRNTFLKELKTKIEEQNHKNLKIYFDKLWIVQDCQTKEYYIMEIFKIGFQKYINNDGKTNSQKSQELFQAYLHYSFEYSNYNYILSDIQGFGSTLNDISIHSQKFIDSFQNINNIPQLLKQFEHQKKINMSGLQTNFPIYSNLGILGIVLFFNQHKCSSYCKALNLLNIEQYQDLTQKTLQKNKTINKKIESITEKEFDDGFTTFNNNLTRGRNRERYDSPSERVCSVSDSRERRKLLNQMKETQNK
ncbi:hypothetical protein ABPG72_004748 [Tetrahymena utriculariae]